MKILKYFLIAVVLLILGLTAYLSSLDGNYDTTQSMVMKAPAEEIFPLITNFKEWPKWSPWSESFGDNMKIEYSGAENGVGAKYSWSGEESGSGNMETMAIDEFNSIDQIIEFKGVVDSKADIYWTFEKVENGTKVTWGMKGEMGFLFRPMAASMDEFMENDLLRGLAKLDSISSFILEEEIAVEEMMEETEHKK